MQEPRRPEVVLVRSSSPLVLEPLAPTAPPRRAWWLLSLTAFALLLAGTSTSAEVPVPPEPLEVRLVATDEVAVSQSGVLVVPLELRNAGRSVAAPWSRTWWWTWVRPQRSGARSPGCAARSSRSRAAA